MNDFRIWYRRLVSSIKEADVRLVAACFENHIGKENAVTLPQLSARVNMDERKIRVILNKLVVDYGLPIGANSGKAGRYLIATRKELDEVVGDLGSRKTEIDKRMRALQSAKLYDFASVKEPELTAPTLFDMQDEAPSKFDQQWRW